MKRHATAIWHGDGQTGQGQLTTQSGVMKEQPYSFQTRFKSEDGRDGTNPEELIGAAHAGCFTMALSFKLAAAGFTADELRTTASVELQSKDGGFVISNIELALEAKIPGIEESQFQEIAKDAKENCPVSRALSATPMNLEAKLI